MAARASEKTDELRRRRVFGLDFDLDDDEAEAEDDFVEDERRDDGGAADLDEADGDREKLQVGERRVSLLNLSAALKYDYSTAVDKAVGKQGDAEEA